jgi:hypothetical protein
LLLKDIRHKVSHRENGRPVSRGAGASGRDRRGKLNQKLRKLVEQLGEAIHESVSESEQIAGVVQDIRRQGFDVLLMLEATIGLNEVAESPVVDAGGAAADGAAFTAQDVNFLRSLRIAIEGDEGVGGDTDHQPPGTEGSTGGADSRLDSGLGGPQKPDV